jgi:hypothetical protein
VLPVYLEEVADDTRGMSGLEGHTVSATLPSLLASGDCHLLHVAVIPDAAKNKDNGGGGWVVIEQHNDTMSVAAALEVADAGEASAASLDMVYVGEGECISRNQGRLPNICVQNTDIVVRCA